LILCRIVIAFGLLNVLLLLIAALMPLPFNGLEYGWSQASSLMILQGFITAAMIYAASEKLRGSDNELCAVAVYVPAVGSSVN
jgi:hypothetical protein